LIDLDFSFSGQIDVVAIYAAILSTLIAVWEFFKWRGRNAVEVRCNPNMLFVPSSDDKKYIIANVTNKGNHQTTITHFVGYYWKNRFDKFFNKNREAFIVSCPDLPKVVHPGEQWMGQAHQTEELEKKAKEGFFYMGIIHSMGNKDILKRIIIEDKTPHKGAGAL
jgi:hypothetical protein